MYAIIKYIRHPHPGSIETVIICDDRADAIDRAVLLAADSDMMADRENDMEADLLTRIFHGSGHHGNPDAEIFVVRAFRP